MSSTKTKDLGTIRSMIEWFDGYSQCYNADPFKIEKLVNKRKDQDDEITKSWQDIREDVSDIITLPDSSEEISNAQKKVKIYRPISAILVFGSGLAVLLVSALHIDPNRSVLLGVLIVLFAVYATILFQWYRGNKKLYRMVRNYYRTNGGKISKQRSRIKAKAQGLIDSLTLTVRNNKLDPMKYQMRLLSSDYTNIRVLKENTQKNMDRPVYTAVVKARTPAQD